MNFYGIDKSDTNLRGPVTSLKILYEGMPKTSGCDQCAAINGDKDKDWCCHVLNPSMYYVEFLKVWEHVEKNWNKEKKTRLIMRAIKNYLRSDLNKGCIFYENGCSVHQHRPLACRMYGTIPQESWASRWRILDERHKDEFDDRSRTQCILVQSDRPVSLEEEDKWFKQTRKCEERIGIAENTIQLHDAPGGSYRSFHDHLLIELYDPMFLSNLTDVRMTKPSMEKIEEIISEIEKQLSKQNAK